MALVGGAVGIGAALALSRSLETLLHGVPSTDPRALAAVAAVFVFVAVLASWLPALRAGRVDPVRALRGD